MKFDERELRELKELALSLFLRCGDWESSSGYAVYSLGFMSDINTFILLFSGDPLALIDKADWLPETYTSNPKVRGLFQMLSQTNDDFTCVHVDVPPIFEAVKDKMESENCEKDLICNVMNKFYRFFDLFGRWILSESDQTATYEKKREQLVGILTSIRNSIDN